MSNNIPLYFSMHNNIKSGDTKGTIAKGCMKLIALSKTSANYNLRQKKLQNQLIFITELISQVIGKIGILNLYKLLPNLTRIVSEDNKPHLLLLNAKRKTPSLACRTLIIFIIRRSGGG